MDRDKLLSSDERVTITLRKAVARCHANGHSDESIARRLVMELSMVRTLLSEPVALPKPKRSRTKPSRQAPCAVCGSEFEVIWQGPDARRKYCSDECTSIGRRDVQRRYRGQQTTKAGDEGKQRL